MLKELFYSFVAFIQELWTYTTFKEDKFECIATRFFAMLVVAITLTVSALLCGIALLLFSHLVVLFWIIMSISLVYIITYGITKLKLPK